MRLAHIFMLMLILFLAQTGSSIDSLVSWFASFLPIVLWLFIFIVIIMFLYAVLKAPLDVLRKGMAFLALLVAQTTTTVAPDAYITNLALVFWGLLGSILIFLLPLLLILLLYKSFMVLVKAK